MMKSWLHILGIVCWVLLAGCKDETPWYLPKEGETSEGVGYLVISGLTVSVADDEVITSETEPSELSARTPVTKAMTAEAETIGSAEEGAQTRASSVLSDAGDDYVVTIRNDKTSDELQYTYGELKQTENQKIPLQPGSYTISAESPDYADYVAGTNYANWDMPVYVGSVTKNIVKETETTVDDLVCTLGNIKTTVAISPDLQSLFISDNQATEQLPALTVTLSIGGNQLTYGRQQMNDESKGYFKAVENSNTITVTLSGAYNKAAGNAVPEYVPIQWTREISDCQAGQWRKISINVVGATQGDVEFQMSVENWVYDEKINVDVMQFLSAIGEETIPDEDISDPNSPVVTLDGADIAQGYTISQDMFDELLGKWNQNLRVVMTPQSGVTVRSAKLVFASDNADFLTALSSAGYPDQTVSVWPQNANLNAYLLIQENGSTGELTATVTDPGMTALFGYKGTHTIKFVVADVQGRTSYTTLTIRVTEGGSVGSAPEVRWTNKAGTFTYDFDTRYPISDSDPEVKISVTSATGIVGFTVDIDSETLTPSELQGLNLSTHMDLVNPGEYKTPLENLHFPTGDAVAGQKALEFDISQFMPLLKILGPGNSDFKLTVTDAGGVTVKTIMLNVPQE